MKTTIEIPDELLQRAKRAALAGNTSLKAVIVKALQRELGPEGDARPPLRVPVWPAVPQSQAPIPAEEVLRMIREERDGFRKPGEDFDTGAPRKSEGSRQAKG